MSNVTAIFEKLSLSTLESATSTGQWWASTEGRELHEVINPSTGEVMAQVAYSTVEDYELLKSTTQKAAQKLSRMPAPQRGALVKAIGEAIAKHKDALGALVSLEVGKILSEGLGEVQEAIDLADFAVGQSRMLYGLSMHSERPAHRMYEQWHPLGSIGIITAFNFPIAVWSWNALLSIVCGNAQIWKPSPKGLLCAIAIQKICAPILKEANLEGLLCLWCPKDNESLSLLIDDKDIPLISFTGSTPVGQQVAPRVASRFGRYLLELGGNNAAIICEDANLDLAIPAVLFSAVGTAGQRCTTTRRLFIHQSRYEEVSQALIHAYTKVPIGNPLSPESLMGPLISASSQEAFIQAVHGACQAGGSLCYGGECLERAGFFVQPTLIATDHHNPWVHQETFAPILYLMPFESWEEVITQHNATEHGLSSALFANDLHTIESFLCPHGSDCGIANVNLGTSGAEIGGAFGGEKSTGGGREAGSDSWKAYMRRQTVTLNWGKELALAQGVDFQVRDH